MAKQKRRQKNKKRSNIPDSPLIAIIIGILLTIISILITIIVFLLAENRQLERALNNLRNENIILYQIATSWMQNYLPRDVLFPKPEVPQQPALPTSMDVGIEFTEIPTIGEGPETRGDIAGRVIGLADPTQYRIVLYAFTDYWYVQPMFSQPFTNIGRDGRWTNWTHLGYKYAALVVTKAYQPRQISATLPAIGGDVLAMDIREAR